jgi:hypothetical protein
MTDDYSFGFGIETRYHGPTNTRGSRVSAQSTDDRKCGVAYITYDDALDSTANHEAAARKWLQKWIKAYPYSVTGYILAACGSDRGYIFIAQTRAIAGGK